MVQPTPPPYIPAPLLISSSRLTAAQLESQFQDFSCTLRYVSTAPELVFERVVANLSDGFNAALRVSELENEKLKAEIEELKGNVPGVSAPPGPSQAVVAVKRNPVIGTFHTNELRSWKEVRHNTSKVVTFAEKYAMVPGLVVGLTELDIYRDMNACAKAFTSKIQCDRFEIHLDSWGDTKLYGAGCAWLQIEAHDVDFQYGNYYTVEDRPSTSTQMQNTRKIKFKRAYTAPPMVVVWLSLIDLGQGSSWRIKVFATDVTTVGFTIHINTWGDSMLYNAVVSWISYPADRPGVASGCFSTLDRGSWAHPQLYNSAYEPFGDGVFEKPPRTFVAINSLDIGRGDNMRLTVRVDNVSEAGMSWHLDSWQGTVMYSAGASYIALA